MIGKFKILTASICLALLLLPGCISKTKLISKSLVPAKYNELANVKSIIVLPFTLDGRINNEITDRFEAAIASIRVGNQPYFNVTERGSLDRIITKYVVGSNGTIDPNSALKVGKKAGVQAVILGAVTRYNIERAQIDEYEDYCVLYDRDDRCTNWTKVPIPCEHTTAVFAFIPKMISVATGKISAAETIERKSKDVDCGNRSHISSISSDDTLINNAMKMAFDAFKEMIAPHYQDEVIVLFDRDNSEPSEIVQKQIKQGIRFAGDGRMDRACEIWKTAAAMHKAGYLMPYLLGVCAETFGNLHQAFTLYKTADNNTTHSVIEINEALTRVEVKLEDQVKLDKTRGSPK
ncbi:MAG: hypothetical protein V3U75_07915 [Methylococcaceae bacterium]